MWKRVVLAVVLVLLQLPVLAALVVGWLLTGGILYALAAPIVLIKYVGLLIGSRIAPRMKGLALVITILAVALFWILSHAEPQTFGSCHAVVLQFGRHPTIQQCDPYSPVDFAIPLGIILVLVFLATDGDIKIGLFGWTLEKRARQVAITLQQNQTDIDRRATEFEQTIKAKPSA